MKTTIHYATGRHVTYATRDEAVEAIMATYPDAVVYDDGARALGCTWSALRRAARRVGVTWPAPGEATRTARAAALARYRAGPRTLEKVFENT